MRLLRRDHSGSGGGSHSRYAFQNLAAGMFSRLQRVVGELRKGDAQGHEKHYDGRQYEQDHTAICNRGPRDVDSRFAIFRRHCSLRNLSKYAVRKTLAQAKLRKEQVISFGHYLGVHVQNRCAIGNFSVAYRLWCHF